MVGSEESSKTVRFDVGGQIYKVSRSLLELYPNTTLARMVDKKWQNETAQDAIFIDRSPIRFEYILDYMRDRKVSLPMTVSATALRTDMEYFGFDNVEELSIAVGKPAEAGPLVAAIVGNVYDDLAQFDVQIRKSEAKTKELKQRKLSLNVAHEVFLRSASMMEATKGPHRVEIIKDTMGYYCDFDERYLEECLAKKYGIQLVSSRSTDSWRNQIVVVKRSDSYDEASHSRMWVAKDDAAGPIETTVTKTAKETHPPLAATHTKAGSLNDAAAAANVPQQPVVVAAPQPGHPQIDNREKKQNPKWSISTLFRSCVK